MKNLLKTILLFVLLACVPAHAEIQTVTATFHYDDDVTFRIIVGRVSYLIRHGWKIIDVSSTSDTVIFVLQSPEQVTKEARK